MKKVVFVTGTLCAFLTLTLFAVQAQKSPQVDEDIIETTDVLAIPLDESADEEEAELNKLEKMQKQEQAAANAAKEQQQKK